MPVFIIAEAGVNHNGSLKLAKKLIDVAVEAGADAVKFQTFKAENLVTKTADKAGYQKQVTGSDESQFQMLKKLELSGKDHVELYDYCRKAGIMFLSTPFDFESADLLEKLGVELFKISSGDITNMPFLKYVARKNKPIVLSTGMSTLGEVEEAIDWIKQEGNEQIKLLHCTTSYPTLYTDVNLRAMETLRDAFKLPVGYSDHTPGIEIPIAAAAMGACIIEKHFTLDNAMEGPDHKASLEPDELKSMVSCIRNIEMALGDGVKKVTEKELQNLNIVRKSIVAARKIYKGHTIHEKDMAIKRPQTGISPKYFSNLVGKTVQNDVEPDEPIKWEYLLNKNKG